MSKQQEAVNLAANPFLIAIVDGRYARFDTTTNHEGLEGVVTQELLPNMTKEALGELYGKLASVSTKNFKTKEIAIESVAYQVAKMSIFDPNAPKPVPVVKGTKKTSGTTTAATGDKKYARKAPDVFELINVPDAAAALKNLAPQAQEIVLAMTELVELKGSPSFTSEEIVAHLNKSEIAARLNTVQEPVRILKYYKGKLISAGLIKVS